LSSEAEILKQNCSLRNRHFYSTHYITCDLVHLPNKVLTTLHTDYFVDKLYTSPLHINLFSYIKSQ